MQEYTKKILGSGNTTLIISNEEMNGIIKIVQTLQGLKMKQKNKKEDF